MPVLLQKKKKLSRRITAPIGEPFVVSEADSSADEPDASGIIDALGQTKSPTPPTPSTIPTVSNSPQIASDKVLDEPDDSGIISALKLQSPDAKVVDIKNEPDASGILIALGKPTQIPDETGKFINNSELWTGAKDDELLKLDYADNDNISIEERLRLQNWQKSHPTPTSKDENPLPNPSRLMKSTPLQISGGNPKQYPSGEEVFRKYLETTAPNLVPYLDNFEAETGRPFAKYGPVWGTGKWEGGWWNLNYSPTEELVRKMNAYAKGGLNLYNVENKKISQEQDAWNWRKNQMQVELDSWKKEHPYYSQFMYGLKDDTKIGFVQLTHNLEYLTKALMVSAVDGFNSKAYEDLINEDAKKQKEIFEAQALIPKPETTGQSVSRAIGGAAGQLPKMVLAGESLPLLVFLENVHRGVNDATKEAFMFLPMMAAGKLLGGYTASAVGEANYSLASRVTRQLETRLGQGAIFTITDFASNPSEYLNGEKPFAVLQSIDKQKSLLGAVREGAGARAIGTFATGALFPVGKVSGEPTFPLVSTPEDIMISRLALPSSRVEVPLRPENYIPFAESEIGVWKGNWDDVVLNYLTLKKNKEEGRYQTGDLQKDVDRLANINQSLEVLESALPKEWIDYVSQHEDAIRTAKQGGEVRHQFRAKAQSMRESGEISSDVEKISTFDVVDWIKEGHSKFGEVGKDNKFVPQEKVSRDISATNVSLDQQINIENKRSGNERGAIGEFEPNQDRVSKRWYDENKTRLSRIGAFYVEAGITDFSEFSNRLQNDLGNKAFDKLGNNRVREIFDEGHKFYNSNIADPFFSGLKQNVIERFPDGNMNVKSARNLINRLGAADEIEWTVGLEEYLQNAEKRGRPINKTELVNVIQNGQIKVNETVLGNKFTNQEWYEFDELKRKEKDNELLDAEKERLSELRYQLGQNELKSTRYDLETYGSREKLELEGGKESKEVLLQIPRRSLELPNDVHIESGIDYSRKIRDNTYNNEDYTLVITNDTNQVVGIGWESGEEGAKRSYFDNKLGKEEVFTHAHYSDFPNYFAHFRANFRTLMDGITKVFHGEEFQSDWNQAGRKQGYSLAEKDLNDIGNELNDIKIKREKLNLDIVRAQQTNDGELLHSLMQEESVLVDRERELYYKRNSNLNLVPKNPFMENNWKELAFKRFLRMGIEKGVDGVTWTTARQQQERYTGTIEGKEIVWQRNNDDTFTIGVSEPDSENVNYPDSAQSISIKEIARLTNSDIANRIEKGEGAGELYSRHGVIKLEKPINLNKLYVADYDTYFVNLAKKIAKRFGGEYRVERIETSSSQEVYQVKDQYGEYYGQFSELHHASVIANSPEFEGKATIEGIQIPAKIEEVHFLSISPQMRESLKQGFPFYGLGLEELPISQRKTGIRNQIFPRVEFDSNLRDIVNSLANVEHPDSGTVFNSGLNPHAFAHQVRVLYQGFKDATSFAHQLISDYREEIKPHIEKLWNFAKAFDADERGFLNIFGDNRPAKEGKLESIEEATRNVIFSSMRSITLAQVNKYFRQVYEGMRDVRLTLNGYSSVLIQQMKDARDLAGYKGFWKNQNSLGISAAADKNVVRALYTLNEEGSRAKTRTYYDDNTLRTRFNLSDDGIKSFRMVRQAQSDILNLRMKQELYHDYKKLATQTPNSPEYLATEQHIQDTKDRYQYLKDTGYISLQRRGNIAIYAEDTNYPIGDERRVIYTHAKNWKEAKRIELDYKRQGFSNIEKHKIFKLKGDLDFMRRLTPSQLQDAIISSGADPATRYWDAASNSWQDTEIGKVTNEVLSRYSSQSYKIQRNLVRGYEVSWKNLLDTMLHQARVYSSSFYSDIGRENALDMLNASGIRDFVVNSKDANGNIVNRKFQSRSDANTYKNQVSGLGHTDISISNPDITTYNVTKSYIEDETTPSSRGPFGLNKRLSQARAITYITQMGLDVSQFLINQTQPFVMTYAQLAKSEQTGLKGLKPEVIMTKAWYDVAKLLNYERKINSARKVGLTPKSGLPKEMTDLFHRAIDEDVVKAELTTGYAASQLGAGSKLEKIADFTSVFARAGEHVTRTQAFAAFYHAGKEKGLTGNSLYNFIVENVKQTHGESSYGEAPRIIRSMGEFGRLFYQFGAFNHMWWENLGTAIKSDVNTKTFKGLAGGATVRHLGAMGIVSGLVGLPLAAGIRAVIASVYGNDKQKQFENSMKERISEQGISPETSETLKNLALYGFTGRRGVSSRLGMRVPIIDSIADAFTIGPDVLDSIPAFATAKQIANAPKDLLRHEGFRFAEDISPRAARNIIRAFRFERYGARRRAVYGENLGDVLVPRGRFSNWDLYLQGIGITPTQVTNEYEKKKYEALGTFAKSGKRSLKRYFNQYFQVTPTQNGNQ